MKCVTLKRVASALLACVAFACFAVPTEPVQAQVIPEWTVADQPVEVGPYSVDLHGVSGAAPLPNGSFVVVDRGNTRVLVFSSEGELVHTPGREGSGPEEFDMPYRVFTAGDTVIVYDTGLNGLSMWLGSGGFLGTIGLPAYNQLPISTYEACYPPRPSSSRRAGH